jgi:hypothetical protein
MDPISNRVCGRFAAVTTLWLESQTVISEGEKNFADGTPEPSKSVKTYTAIPM